MAENDLSSEIPTEGLDTVDIGVSTKPLPAINNVPHSRLEESPIIKDSPVSSQEKNSQGEEEARAFLEGVIAEAAKKHDPEHIDEINPTEIAQQMLDQANVNPEQEKSEPDEQTMNAFRKGIQLGQFGGLTMVPGSEREEAGGHLSAEVEDEKGNKIRITTTEWKPSALYLVADPNESELPDYDSMIGWLEKELEPLEINSEVDIDPTIRQSLTATINNLPTIIAKRTTGVLPATDFGMVVDPDTGVTRRRTQAEAIRNMRTTAEARISYHNTQLDAKYSLDEFANHFAAILPEQHEAILNTPGIREGIEYVESSQGQIFRLNERGTPAVVAAYRAEVTNLQNSIRTGLMATLGRAPTAREEERAYDLTMKSLFIFGEASRYAGMIDPTTGAVVMDVNTPPEKFAEYVRDNWDSNPNWANNYRNQIQNNLGNSRIAYTIYNQFSYGLPQEGNPGRAKYLWRYMSLGLSSALNYERHEGEQERDPGTGAITGTGNSPRQSLVEQMENMRTDYRRVRAWASSITAASKNKVQFNEKDEESILVKPFLEPNIVSTSNYKETVAKNLENYFKGIAVYGYIPSERTRNAGGTTINTGRNFYNNFLLEGLLTYIRNPEIAREDGFNYIGWGQYAIDEAIKEVALVRGKINGEQSNTLLQKLRTSKNIAALQGSTPLLGEGFLSGLGRFFKGIVDGK